MQSLLSVMLLQGALLYSRRPHNDISLIYSISVQTSGKICAFIKSAANENLSHPFTISYSPLGSVHYNMSEFRILHLSFRFTNLTAFPEQRRNFPLLLVQPQKNPVPRDPGALLGHTPAIYSCKLYETVPG